MAWSAQPANVAAADLVRNFGRWQESTAGGPLFVTVRGRKRYVLLSIDHYDSIARNGFAERSGSEEGHVRLDTVLDRIEEGFLSVNPEMRVQQVNPAACAYLRDSRSNLIGRNLIDGFGALAHSLILAHLRRAATAGEIGDFDAPSFAFRGEWLHIRTFPLGDGAGCLFTNITREVEVRRAFAASEALTAAMAAHAGIGRGTLSPRATFVEVDRQLAALAGFEPETLMRARLTDIVAIDRRVAVGEAIEAVMSGQGPRALDSLLMVNRGDPCEVRIALSEVRGDYASEGAIVVISAR